MPATPDLKRRDEILGAVRAGIGAVDGQGVVELQNVEASRILGISAETAIGRPFEQGYGADHPLSELIRETLDGDRDLAFNALRIPPRLAGEERIVDAAVSAVPHANPPGGVVALLYDRTIRQELEQRADQETRSEVFARLAAGMAHELRNPLGGIRGAAELLLGKLGDDGLSRFPRLIRGEADRMRRLLDDLSELTQGGDLRLRPDNLHALLDNLLDLQGQSENWKRVRYRREYDPSIPELRLDSDRITQVFLNLIRNVAQAIDHSGTLVLRTRVEADYHLSEGERPLHMVRVDVIDSGRGIPEEDLPHVFTPFFSRRRSGGTGLGLAIAQHWVVRHGGRIQISSRVGEGTRVSVRLPLRRDE